MLKKDDEVVLSFSGLLKKDYGYHIEAPFSGTQYDLADGHMTVYAEGKRIEKKSYGGDPRAVLAYNTLVAAAESLLALAKSCRGRANKDLAKFTSQIRNLTEKWK